MRRQGVDPTRALLRATLCLLLMQRQVGVATRLGRP
jgi:hypothetical protein